MPGELHRLYSPWDRKESNTTEQPSFLFSYALALFAKLPYNVFLEALEDCHTLSGAGPQRCQVVLFAVFFSSSSLLPPRSAASVLHASCFSRDRRSPRQHLRGATTHISDTRELPMCQIWARFCAGVGKPSPTSPWATHCYLLPQSIQRPRLIFPEFTLESRSICLQSLQWLPKTCIRKLKPLASLYNSHSESGRGSFLELTCSSWEHLRASHVTASPLA